MLTKRSPSSSWKVCSNKNSRVTHSRPVHRTLPIPSPSRVRFSGRDYCRPSHDLGVKGLGPGARPQTGFTVSIRLWPIGLNVLWSHVSLTVRSECILLANWGGRCYRSGNALDHRRLHGDLESGCAQGPHFRVKITTLHLGRLM
jgi:hypothetical protein